MGTFHLVLRTKSVFDETLAPISFSLHWTDAIEKSPYKIDLISDTSNDLISSLAMI